MPLPPRTLHQISRDISDSWGTPSLAAKPYLVAMLYMGEPRSRTARAVVRGFLKNSTKWRGPAASRIKRELRTMIGEEEGLT